MKAPRNEGLDLGPADPVAVAKIAQRFNRIAQHTGMAGMNRDMSDHIIRHVRGIPRTDVSATYIDENSSIINLFNHGKDVDNSQLWSYEDMLKNFERHARAGRQSFEAYLAGLNEREENDERAREQAAKLCKRYS